MPINIPGNLPAKDILESENIFVMDEHRAYKQNIRPLNIAILNLMPEKEKTETQLLRLLGSTPLQVNVTLLHPKTHQSKTTRTEHLQNFYRTFDDVKNRKFDGMIITGAPIGHMEFDQVNYWTELKEIMDFTVNHVTSTLHICWGALAGLYHHYNIQKYQLDQKLFGVFPHELSLPHARLLRGFDDMYNVPHARFASVKKDDILNTPDLDLFTYSEEAGVCLAASKNRKQVFLLGHPEYDSTTLKEEYERDIKKGKAIDIPKNYFKNNDPLKRPANTWQSHANLLFVNWLNYYVYQETPYIWE